MPSESEKIKLLCDRIKYAPSREWVNSYFELVNRIISFTGLNNDDPRLVISLSSSKSGWHFPVSINNRYVVALRKIKEDQKDKLIVGLIFDNSANHIEQLKYNFNLNPDGQFRNLPGEKSDPPYFLRFDNFPELLFLLESDSNINRSWHNALSVETTRAKSSPYRKFHEPLMYRMAVDINFRADILNMVYMDSKPDLGLLPEQVDDPQEFYEGSLKSITINAYERNPQARDACLKHYGAKCSICGMTFHEKYGDIGKGFIHVHHIKPLGEISAEYKVDPIRDLCPVCPNCHAMLHLRKPAYSIDEIKSLLKP